MVATRAMDYVALVFCNAQHVSALRNGSYRRRIVPGVICKDRILAISKVGERCVEEKFAPFRGRHKLRGSYTRPSSFNQKIISLLQINIDFARFKFDRFCLRADRPALLLKSTKLNGADQDQIKGETRWKRKWNRKPKTIKQYTCSTIRTKVLALRYYLKHYIATTTMHLCNAKGRR